MNYKEKIKEKGLLMKWVAKQVPVHHVLLSYYINNARPMPERVENRLKEILK